MKKESTVDIVGPTTPISVLSPEERMEKVEKTLEKMTDVLSSLAASLPQKKQETSRAAPTPVQFEIEKEKAKSLEVPPSWRAIVDEYLGVDFETVLKESSNGNFSMLVVFPPRIDRRVGIERNPNTPDMTMFSPIRLASTVDDIKKWCVLTVQNIKQTPAYNKFIPKVV